MDDMTTGDVARIFQVAPSTIHRWTARGLLTCYTLPSGQRRYDPVQVQQIRDMTPKEIRTRLREMSKEN